MQFGAKAVSALVTTLLTAVPIWAKPDINDLGRQCRLSGKQSACRMLAKIATEDKDASTRVVAVKNLVDQSVLAKIATEDNNAGVRAAAVEVLAYLKKTAVEMSGV